MAAGFFTLVDSVVSQALQNHAKQMQDLLSIVGILGATYLTAWIIWHGYSILIGAVEGEVTPFLQRMISKYFFLFAAVGMGFSTDGLIQQGLKLQDMTVEIFNKDFNGSAQGVSERNAMFLQTDQRIGAYLTNAASYAAAEVVDTSPETIDALIKECEEFQYFESQNQSDKNIKDRTVQKAKRCASLAGIKTEQANHNAQRYVQRAMNYLTDNKIDFIAPFVVSEQGEARWSASMSFMWRSWMMAGTYVLFGLAEIIVGFCLLLPILFSRLAFSLSLMVAPIFIFCGAWDKTKGFFNSWLNTVLGYCLALPLLGFGTGIMYRIKDQIFSGIRSVDSGGGMGEFSLAIVSIPMALLMGLLLKYLMDLSRQWVEGGRVASVADKVSRTVRQIDKTRVSKQSNKRRMDNVMTENNFSERRLEQNAAREHFRRAHKRDDSFWN